MLAIVQKIRLNMIVRDESPVIERCLASVKPLIDDWVIVDTGSEDDTKEKVAAALDGIPGTLLERPWRDFGHNRTEAFALAREGADYLLFVDADDVWETDDGFSMPRLTEDGYYVRMSAGGESWRLLMLVNASKPWYWKTKRHASLVCRGSFSSDILDGARILCGNDGHRRSTQSSTEKYGKDADVFEAALVENPGDTRAMFYCAQSHKDAGNTGRAIFWYERRAAAGGWWEEVYVSHMRLGRLYARIGAPPSVSADHYLAAYELAPRRAEPLVQLSAYYRSKKEYAKAHLYACAAKELPYPRDLLFIEDAVYQWRALDEYAITAQRIGKLEEARRANEKLLEIVPEREREHIEANMRWCRPSGPVTLGGVRLGPGRKSAP